MGGLDNGRMRKLMKTKTARERPDGAQKRGMHALKVQNIWLRQMQTKKSWQEVKGPKRVEVRFYRPKKHCPVRIPHPRCRTRLYLICRGTVQGSCTLQRVAQYRGIKHFNQDSSRHHVTPLTPRFFGLVQEAFRTGEDVFGWQLGRFRWFDSKDKSGLPRSGAVWRGVRVPRFHGLEHGMVWADTLLPAALEANIAPGH